VVDLGAKHVRKVIGDIADTPGQARTLFAAISALMSYAIDTDVREDNPCRGVKRPKLSKHGWHAWTDAEIEAYRARHPLGTMARLALELALCSIQRRSDLVLLGRQHVKDGLITVTQQMKTGNPAYVEITPELQEAIDAMPARPSTPTELLTFLLTSRRQAVHAGRPYAPL